MKQPSDALHKNGGTTMRLIKESVMRPVGVMISALVLIMLGAVSLSGLKVDLMPELELPIVAVSTPYQGAAPQEVESLVTRPLEGALSATEGLETIQSISTQNQSLIILMFDFDTDLDATMLDLRERVDMVRSFLPDGADTPSVMRFDPNQMPIMQIAVSSEMDIVRLTDIAENRVLPQLERVSGVASVSLTGGKEREIIIEPDLTTLQKYGLSLSQLAQIIASENLTVPAGEIERGGKEMSLRIVGEFENIKDIENVNIPTRTGEAVKLSHIANVKDTYKEQQSYAYVNGTPTLTIDISKQSDANTVEVARAVSKEIEKIDSNLPENISLITVMDTSIYITDSVKNVTQNMIIGGVMAVLILLLFLRSIRSTFIIGISIPIAIISAFTLLYFTGQTLNVITMGGLALGIGLLIDNCIVVLENIYKFRERGYSRLDAAIKAPNEVASAVIASTLTSLAVFVPIIFTTGIARELFLPLALTVGFTLTASLVVAITVVPMLSRYMLPNIKSEENPRGLKRLSAALGNGINKLISLYETTLKWALNHMKTIVFSVVLLLAASLGAVPLVGLEFVPPFDQGEISATFETPEGTPFDETREVVSKIEDFLLDTGVTEVVNTSIGGGGMYGFSAGGKNTGSFYVRLTPASERDISTGDFIKQLEDFAATIPNIDMEVMSIESGGMAGEPINIEIRGENFDTLKTIAEDLTEIISDVPGTTNVSHSMGETRPEMQLIVNRDLAYQYGLSYGEVMDAVRSAIGGQVATLMRMEGQELNVTVILPEEYRENFAQLQNLPIMTMTGDTVPLSTIAEFVQVEGPTSITRQDQARGVSITGGVVDRDLGSVTADIEKKLDEYAFPDGYDYHIGGEYEEMMETFTDLALALILGIFLIYAVMAFQFEKLLYPFIIMFSIPPTFIGIMFGFIVTGQSLSTPAFIGIIMLAGIVVNNAIILIDYTLQLRERGYSREEAIIEAGKTRLRPILMTALTTIFAMIPLALGFGEGSELQAPMATVIIFGLSFSTLITLVFVPVVYIYADKFTNWVKKLFRRKKRTEIETES